MSKTYFWYSLNSSLHTTNTLIPIRIHTRFHQIILSNEKSNLTKYFFGDRINTYLRYKLSEKIFLHKLYYLISLKAAVCRQSMCRDTYILTCINSLQ